jgi:uncharacterized integral membrane protein (TIGR00698 family)
MNETKKWDVLPGIILTLIIAFIAQVLEAVLPVEFIGASVLALFLGVLFNYFRPIKDSSTQSGVTFASKRVLKLAIILLGASLNIATILETGQITLIVMVFTFLVAFGGGHLLSKLFGIDWKLSSLISSGTAICGGTAIASVSPIIDAEDHQISYAMSSVFLFDMVMIILFPLFGQWLGMSDISYGLWAGTAINDTSSVVAAGYAFSEAAGDFATMVKLTRTLAIIPTVIIFSFIQIRALKKEAVTENGQTNVNIDLKKVFPWFILGFLAMALLNSLGFIPVSISQLFKDLSRFLIVIALAAIGLKTDLNEMKHSGITPILHGFLVSSLVIITSLTVIYVLTIL